MTDKMARLALMYGMGPEKRRTMMANERPNPLFATRRFLARKKQTEITFRGDDQLLDRLVADLRSITDEQRSTQTDQLIRLIGTRQRGDGADF